jgi:hypothetical protein
MKEKNTSIDFKSLEKEDDIKNIVYGDEKKSVYGVFRAMCSWIS